jgi:hypothetical protein
VKRLLPIALLLALTFCKKQGENPGDTPPEEPAAPVDTGLGCRNLPPTPVPFGWYDSIRDPDENITAFVINPVNPSEAIIVVEGNILGYNKMFTFNIPSRTSKYLASIGDFLPQVNKQGWILYNTSDFDIFKIKANGDSLTQLTHNKRSMDPKWDHTGKNFYYLETAYLNMQSAIIKRTASGVFLNQIEAGMPNIACFKKSDKILLMRVYDTTITVYQRTLTSGPGYGSEKAVATGSFSIRGEPFFDDLTVDCDDQYMYWCNSKGVFRQNLSGGTPELVLKSCGNYKFMNPLIISANPSELTVSCHFMIPLDARRLYHEYRPYQMNIATRELTRLRIFQ